MLRVNLMSTLSSFLHMTYVLKTWFCDKGHTCSHDFVPSYAYAENSTIRILLQSSCVSLNTLSAGYHNIFI